MSKYIPHFSGEQRNFLTDHHFGDHWSRIYQKYRDGRQGGNRANCKEQLALPVSDWSPRSPDLNPIEHLWDVLEQGLEGHHTAPTNLPELWTALVNI
ncbi:hypothetical protein TNCV_1952691 [Trichonephila clavipes]|nr:hypothetical protein TNCV_1952691 [Trichonephila clavipes]